MARFLLVDDNEQNLYLLRALLTGHSHTVQVARNGREALAAARASLPDAIVSDILMPEMDGFTLCRECKADPTLAPVPFVFYTATYTEKKDEDLALQLGGALFIRKPAEPDEFMRLMDTLLESLPSAPREPAPTGEPSQETLNLYNERLVQKLEKKMLDLEREVAERARAEARLAEAQRIGGLGDWDWDLETDTLLWSDQVHRLMGTSPDTFVPSFRAFVEAVHPEDRPKLEQAVRGVREGGPQDELHVRVVRADGEARWVHLQAEIMRDSSGRAMRMRGTILDMTDRLRAEEERQRLQEQVRRSQRLESVALLAGGIAHDFNNILGAIIGYTELAMERTTPTGPICRDLTYVLAAAERAKDLVSQILAFARQSDTRTMLVDLVPIMKESAKFLRSTLPTSVGIVTEFRACGPVLADPTQVHQVVMNLCTNAEAALSDGGSLQLELAQVEVDRSLAEALGGVRPGPYAKVTVRDDGCGMDEATLERIFDPFFTTKPIGEGTGLGLSTSHGIITGHRGAITVDSTPGVGTAFQVYLPVVSDAVVRTVTDTTAVIPTGTERVLVVDDEAALAGLAREMLGHLGYRATVAADPATALSMFAEAGNAYDAVITDLTMPGMTGLQLGESLRRIRSDVAVVLATGSVERLDDEELAQAGVRGIVMKPYTLRELAEAVRTALNRDTVAEPAQAPR